jgi:hypothetical protein
MMPNWPALMLLAPSLAFANGAVAYALVTPSCEPPGHWWPTARAERCSLLACLLCHLLPRARNWRTRWRIGPERAKRRAMQARAAS